MCAAPCRPRAAPQKAQETAMTKLTESRQSGVLLHPTALPGPHGIGDLGPQAYAFVDWLKSARQQVWQVLPLNPTAHGNSPYASPSAFAGNTLMISLDGLYQDGLLDKDDVQHGRAFPENRVDFAAVGEHRKAVYARAYEKFRAGKALKAELEAFRHRSASWLEDYALFAALHRHFHDVVWPEWEPDLVARKKAALETWRSKLSAEVEQEAFLQFIFARQWSALHKHATANGVRLVGDVPIFVAYDSADAWAHTPLFKLDAKGRPQVVAGVPPDYFSEDGQLWGNPLYNWEEMKRTGYAWWIERIKSVAATVDIIRIDHFRGFEAAWEIPAGEKTAKRGKWVPGPGGAVFDAIKGALGEVPFIAEDLGIITPPVEALRDGLGMPGMKILQFAFGGDEPGANPYLPHNHTRASVVYTGTHDNDTTRGWWQGLDARTRSHVQMYLARDGADISWDLIRSAWSSVACTAVAPLQDVLDLGTEARFNTPGKPEGNWAWRLGAHALTSQLAERLGGLTVLYGRHAGAKPA
ncbi:MAG: 4-alpha-glucanotransferase [Myxococcota bacterium]